MKEVAALETTTGLLPPSTTVELQFRPEATEKSPGFQKVEPLTTPVTADPNPGLLGDTVAFEKLYKASVPENTGEAVPTFPYTTDAASTTADSSFELKWITKTPVVFRPEKKDLDSSRIHGVLGD